jgi:hypothetical protein
MQTTKLAAFEAPKPRPAAPPPRPSSPLISDDLMSQIGKPVETPREDKLTATTPLPPDDDSPQTVKLNPRRASSGAPPGADRTQRMDGPGIEHTQRLNVGEDRTVRTPQGAESTQRMPAQQPPGAEKTQQLDFTSTQKMDASTTQPLDDSIARLQEAKRILQRTQKP